MSKTEIKGFEEPVEVKPSISKEELDKKKIELIKGLRADRTKPYKDKITEIEQFMGKYGLNRSDLYDFHSIRNSYFNDGTYNDCLLCGGEKGYLVETGGGYEGWHECECVKLYKKRKIRERAEIPEIYKNIRVNEIKDVYSKDHDKFERVMTGLKKMLEDTDKWVKEGLGVGIYGEQKGSGKSMLLSAFCNELLDKDYTVKFVNQIELLDRIKASWEREKGENREKESQIFDELKSVDILAIDELGFNDNKSWLNDKMYSIINNRYENKKPIIYTSNKSIKEMQFDERIVSRLKQMVNEVEWVEEDVRGMDAITNKLDFFN